MSVFLLQSFWVSTQLHHLLINIHFPSCVCVCLPLQYGERASVYMSNTVYVFFFDNMYVRQRACVSVRLKAHVYLEFLGRDRGRRRMCENESV